jgi:hypothetical protein
MVWGTGDVTSHGRHDGAGDTHVHAFTKGLAPSPCRHPLDELNQEFTVNASFRVSIFTSLQTCSAPPAIHSFPSPCFPHSDLFPAILSAISPCDHVYFTHFHPFFLASCQRIPARHNTDTIRSVPV